MKTTTTRPTIPAGLTLNTLNKWGDATGDHPQIRFNLELTGPGGRMTIPYSGGIAAFLTPQTRAILARDQIPTSPAGLAKHLLAGHKLRRMEDTQAGVDYLAQAARVDPLDVLHSLTMEAEALNGTFEDFCDNYGLNPDSRKDHATYEQCLTQSREFRKVAGALMPAILEAVQDL